MDLRFAACVAVGAALLIGSLTACGAFGENERPATPAPTLVTTPTAATDVPAGTSSPAGITETILAPNPTAEAGGWELEVEQPLSGTTLGQTVTICYRATGTTREASLYLAVEIVKPGAGSIVFQGSEGITPGRGSATVDLSAVPPGIYDMLIQLVVNDTSWDELSVRVNALVLTNDTNVSTCD